MGPFIVLAATLALTWLLFILPQQRRIKAHQALVATLDVGDEVMTSSGIYGTITALDDETAAIEVAADTVLRFAKGAVARRVSEEGDVTATSTTDTSTTDTSITGT